MLLYTASCTKAVCNYGPKSFFSVIRTGVLLLPYIPSRDAIYHFFCSFVFLRPLITLILIQKEDEFVIQFCTRLQKWKFKRVCSPAMNVCIEWAFEFPLNFHTQGTNTICPFFLSLWSAVIYYALIFGQMGVLAIFLLPTFLPPHKSKTHFPLDRRAREEGKCHATYVRFLYYFSERRKYFFPFFFCECDASTVDAHSKKTILKKMRGNMAQCTITRERGGNIHTEAGKKSR